MMNASRASVVAPPGQRSVVHRIVRPGRCATGRPVFRATASGRAPIEAASPAGPAYAPQWGLTGAGLTHAPRHRALAHPGRPGDQSGPAMADRPRFRIRQRTPPVVETREGRHGDLAGVDARDSSTAPVSTTRTPKSGGYGSIIRRVLTTWPLDPVLISSGNRGPSPRLSPSRTSPPRRPPPRSSAVPSGTPW